MAITILGISPGTRVVGIGVIENGELIEWQVKSFKERWSSEKLNLIVQLILDLSIHFKVSAIAVKETSPLASAKNVRKIMKGIQRMAKIRRKRLLRFTTHKLRTLSAQNSNGSAIDMMESLVEKYPLLRKQYLKERNNLNSYYLPMFEAIAAAHLGSKI